MMAAPNPPGRAARHSLQRRIPLLASALVAAVLLAFLWSADRTVRTTLTHIGGERAQTAADQLAKLLDQQRATEQIRLVANDGNLRRYLQVRSDEARETARRHLLRLAPTGPRRIELWDDAGSRLLDLSVPGPTASGATATVLPAGTRPSGVGIQPLQASGDIVFSETVVEIQEQTPASGRLGFLVIRSTFSVSPPGVISRLVGEDAIVSVGNRSGGIWTDFSHVVPPPDVDATRRGVAEYVAADGERRLGAISTIPGTPFSAWVEFPMALVVAPTGIWLSQMTAVAFILVVIGAVLARVLTARITTPLAELTHAAEAIASGEHSRRVITTRRDEIGRLGQAFNVMAGVIEADKERLEARVDERTAELTAARREADRANRAKSEFLSLMSHDLRTPLNAILGFAQLLEIDSDGTDRSESVRQILRGGNHLLELINELLDITRIESGQLALSPEPVLVHDIVQHAVELIKPLAVKESIMLDVAPIPATDTVYADRQRLSQIVLNLLSNAVKYNRPRGRVTVSAERIPPDRYRITVTDTGSGIPEAKVPLLFQPFERLGAEQTAIEGTGLGLALSRRLAEVMGGALHVRTVVDQGSSFWVELAAINAHAEPAPAAKPTPISTSSRPAPKGSILYIEDNLSNVRLMERIIARRPGIQLQHASQGEMGLAIIHDRHPDLVMLDLHLPDMAGEEVLRSLWADPTSRSIPVVVVTADATPGLSRRLKAAGAVACLTKPLNVRSVLQLIDEILTGNLGRDQGA